MCASVVFNWPSMLLWHTECGLPKLWAQRNRLRRCCGSCDKIRSKSTLLIAAFYTSTKQQEGAFAKPGSIFFSTHSKLPPPPDLVRSSCGAHSHQMPESVLSLLAPLDTGLACFSHTCTAAVRAASLKVAYIDPVGCSHPTQPRLAARILQPVLPEHYWLSFTFKPRCSSRLFPD